MLKTDEDVWLHAGGAAGRPQLTTSVYCTLCARLFGRPNEGGSQRPWGAQSGEGGGQMPTVHLPGVHQGS